MVKYKRVLLKLSGESLMGKQQYGIDSQRLNDYAEQIKEIKWYFNLSEESGDEIINIYLETPPTDRITRMLKRTNDDIEKINEAIRRFNADEKDFEEFEKSDSIKKVISNHNFYIINKKILWGSQEVLNIFNEVEK